MKSYSLLQDKVCTSVREHLLWMWKVPDSILPPSVFPKGATQYSISKLSDYFGTDVDEQGSSPKTRTSIEEHSIA